MGANPVRGEVEATIGSLRIVMVMDMDGLARLSAATGYPAFQDLYARLIGTEPMTVLTAISLFTTGGEVDGRKLGKEEAVSQARLRMTLDDMLALQGPLAGLMEPLLDRNKKKDAPPGNAGSGRSR